MQLIYHNSLVYSGIVALALHCSLGRRGGGGGAISLLNPFFSLENQYPITFNNAPEPSKRAVFHILQNIIDSWTVAQ